MDSQNRKITTLIGSSTQCCVFDAISPHKWVFPSHSLRPASVSILRRHLWYWEVSLQPGWFYSFIFCRRRMCNSLPALMAPALLNLSDQDQSKSDLSWKRLQRASAISSDLTVWHLSSALVHPPGTQVDCGETSCPALFSNEQEGHP